MHILTPLLLFRLSVRVSDSYVEMEKYSISNVSVSRIGILPIHFVLSLFLSYSLPRHESLI